MGLREFRVGLRDLAYRMYERRLEASLAGHSGPRHVGVILDGNRRWARLAGFTDVSNGHQRGADHISSCSAGAARRGSRWSPSGCWPRTT